MTAKPIKSIGIRGILFSIAICAIFAVLVSSAAVLLKPRQMDNQRLYQIRNILIVSGIADENSSSDPDSAFRLYQTHVEQKFIDLKSAAYVEAPENADQYDMMAEAKTPEGGYDAPKNSAGVKRLPKIAQVYIVYDENHAVSSLILPIVGSGLWSTIYGYLALNADGQTIRGVTFYSHGETPGLGGEIDNPRWKEQWKGKQMFDEDGKPAFHIARGRANNEDHFTIDGISGATLTSQGVSGMVQFWLGPDAFGPFIHQFAAAHHIQMAAQAFQKVEVMP